MRFYILVLLSMTFAACVPQPPGAGTENHPCRTGFQANWACNEGLRCVDNTCLQCGDEGEICCGSLDEHCNGSHLACQNGNGGYDGELGLCTAECGVVGQPCCPGFNECPAGGQCIDGMCDAIPGDPCLGGIEKHVMYIINGECDAIEVVFYTNTPEEAEQCRQAYVAAALPNEEICPLDQKPEQHSVCAITQPPPARYQLWSCSKAQLETCQNYLCENCSWTENPC